MNAYLWHVAISQWLNATGNASRVLGEGNEKSIANFKMPIAKCKMKNLRDRGQGFEGSRGQDRKQMVLGSDLNIEFSSKKAA